MTTVSDFAGAPIPGLATGLATGLAARTAPVSTELESLPWFPFEVLAPSRCRPAAARIARRTERAYWFLRQALDVAPRVRLLVLDRASWSRHATVADYGVMHVNDAGDLVVGATPALAWTGVSAWFAEHLDARTLGMLVRVHGKDLRTRGPALGDVAEALVAHELAHMTAAQAGVRFPRRWLAEAFANYAMVAVLGETDPVGLRRLGSLADAAETVAHHTPSLAAFDRAAGELDIMPSVLGQLALTRGVYATYASAQIVPLTRLFRHFRANPVLTVAGSAPDLARPGPVPDADFELGRVLSTHVDPSLAAIPNLFPVPAQRAAA